MKTKKIFVAGHRGLVGSAIVRTLQTQGYNNLLLAPRSELDLTNQSAVEAFFAREKPQWVFLAAAKVGGIVANNRYQADFLYENLMIQNNVIHHAAVSGAEKLLFLGSSCIYPKMAPQPIREDSLLTGPLEPTNEGYAIAKIAGLKLCQMAKRQYGKNFISAMPTNLYGPYDNFHPENSHVIPGLLRRFHEAKLTQQKEVVVWGSGEPRREFLHVDDLSQALLHLMLSYEGESTINVGTGEDLKISELAAIVKKVVGFRGEIVFDRSKPDGTPRKLLDVQRIQALGWKHKIELQAGLQSTYDWAVAQKMFG